MECEEVDWLVTVDSKLVFIEWVVCFKSSICAELQTKMFFNCTPKFKVLFTVLWSIWSEMLFSVFWFANGLGGSLMHFSAATCCCRHHGSRTLRCDNPFLLAFLKTTSSCESSWFGGKLCRNKFLTILCTLLALRTAQFVCIRRNYREISP